LDIRKLNCDIVYSWDILAVLFGPITSHIYNFDPFLDAKVANNKKGDYFLYSGRLSKEEIKNIRVGIF
jgi:hypothetical protein